MTGQLTATTPAHRVASAPPVSPHGHGSTCYWDVTECCWQCVAFAGVGYALEHAPAIPEPTAEGIRA